MSLLLVPIVAAGCGDDDGTPAPVDSGLRADAGGGGGDSGPGGDAGGPGVDAGGLDVDGGVTTMDAGMVSADGGTILPGYDAGDPFGDAGALGPPEWVAMDVRTGDPMCPALVACGGVVEGTWDVGGACIDIPIPTAIMDCPGATVSATGRARGRVTFAAGFATRTAQSEVEVSIYVPALCAAFVGGCTGIESAIQMAVPDSACVTTAAGDCNCLARQTGTIDDMDAYTTTATQIVGTTSGKHWDYCIETDTLRYHDVSTSGMLEPGVISLTRR